jgi:DNA (cytosine-5)-methyltransferase 1
MRRLTMISHFNGIGLFPFAAAQAGIVAIATTEKESFCNAISRQWFPHATQYTDIRTTTGLPYADIICGGDPCQPHSSAGARKGAADVRFLWPEMLRSIDEGRPAWVVNENVIGSVTNGVFDGKKADLEAIGYAVQGFDIPSGAVGSPSLRRRIILVAYRNGGPLQRQPLQSTRSQTHQLPDWLPDATGIAARYADTPTILRMADGSAEGMDSSERRRRIKALGNAIDPQVFIPIFKAIAAVEARLYA